MPHPLYPQAGLSDQRPVLHIVQNHAKISDDLWRKWPVLEGSNDVGILNADLLDIFVFLFCDFVEIIKPQEFKQHIRRDVPSSRDSDSRYLVGEAF
jgi:hypothetical protein